MFKAQRVTVERNTISMKQGLMAKRSSKQPEPASMASEQTKHIPFDCQGERRTVRQRDIHEMERREFLQQSSFYSQNIHKRTHLDIL